jgi:hypothetical protein
MRELLFYPKAHQICQHRVHLSQLVDDGGMRGARAVSDVIHACIGQQNSAVRERKREGQRVIVV